MAIEVNRLYLSEASKERTGCFSYALRRSHTNAADTALARLTAVLCCTGAAARNATSNFTPMLSSSSLRQHNHFVRDLPQANAGRVSCFDLLPNFCGD